MDLEGKKVLIIGTGLSGVSSAWIVYSFGGDVFCVDKSEKAILNAKRMFKSAYIQAEFLPYKSSSLKDIDLVIVSPGVDINEDVIAKKALANDIELLGEMELGYRFWKGEDIIAVTGSNGKTTTTALIGEILKRDSKNVVVAGNIGMPFTDVALKDYKIAVLEVSTFQIETMVNFKPDTAILLNITPDHLNRHKTFEIYKKLKFDLFANMDSEGTAILNNDDIEITPLFDELSEMNILPFSRREILERGAWVENNRINLRVDDETYEILDIDELSLKGPHNLENVLASVLAASSYDVNPETLKEVLRDFEPLEHRLEFVREMKGVRFFNDSKATNLESMKMALLSFDGNINLIAGGIDKGSNFEDIQNLVKERVKNLILIGESTGKLEQTFKDVVNIKKAEGIDEAVQIAFNLSVNGDVVLLSPGCASFDMFKNFEDRGDMFKESVRELREKNNAKR
jgi:UDP-N-acetylmuramoylalanine--D-glutamate ligase